MRQRLSQFLVDSGAGGQEAENVPVIPHETVAYFRLLLGKSQPENLEIGTAIGFGGSLMAGTCAQAQITMTCQRWLAKANFAKYDSRQQITLLEGDAVDLLETLEDSYDLIFMDLPSQVCVFLPQVLKRLNPGGLVLIDDVFKAEIAKNLLRSAWPTGYLPRFAQPGWRNWIVRFDCWACFL